MRILLIGADSRTDAQDALAAEHEMVTKTYVIGENAGVRARGNAEIININPLDPYAILNFAADKGINLTIPHPEAVIATGIGNLFRHEGLAIACPTIEGFLETEGSKSRTMRNAEEGEWWPRRIHHVVASLNAAISMTRTMQTNHSIRIIKEDGLKGGKGVVVCRDVEEAERVLHSLYKKQPYQRIVIDSFVPGEELSATVFVNTQHPTMPFRITAFTQDCKQRSETDSRNTGGMRAHGAVPGCGINSPVYRRTEFMTSKYIDWMRRQQIPDNGVVYFGLKGSSGLEINRRKGSPEGELLARLHGKKLLDLYLGSADKNFMMPPVNPEPGCGVLIVICNREYPDPTNEHRVVRGIKEAEGDPRIKVFHAGTEMQADGTLVAKGGRIVMVTCVELGSDNFENVIEGAYEAADIIIRESDPGLDYRRDRIKVTPFTY